MAIGLLNNPVKEGKYVRIVDLPEPKADCKGLNLVLSGWGQDRTRPYRPRNKLWAVKQRCLNITECKPYNGTGENILCVGDTDKTNSGCKGDSGGINTPVN